MFTKEAFDARIRNRVVHPRSMELLGARGEGTDGGAAEIDPEHDAPDRVRGRRTIDATAVNSRDAFAAIAAPLLGRQGRARVRRALELDGALAHHLRRSRPLANISAV